MAHSKLCKQALSLRLCWAQERADAAAYAHLSYLILEEGQTSGPLEVHERARQVRSSPVWDLLCHLSHLSHDTDSAQMVEHYRSAAQLASPQESPQPQQGFEERFESASASGSASQPVHQHAVRQAAVDGLQPCMYAADCDILDRRPLPAAQSQRHVQRVTTHVLEPGRGSADTDPRSWGSADSASSWRNPLYDS